MSELASEHDPFADGGAAPERTQLAWDRTALALIGLAALEARALFSESVPGAVVATVVLAGLAVVAFTGGTLPPHLRPMPTTKIALLSRGTVLAAVVMIVVSLGGTE